MESLSDNGVSRVWRDGKWVYKRQPKYLTDNEYYALKALEATGYVPRFVEQVTVDTVRMEFVEREPVTNTEMFMAHYWPVLQMMERARLRHGDLTEYGVLVRDNKPIIIDWAESRTWDDPRPDKRREGDIWWLKETMEKLCQT